MLKNFFLQNGLNEPEAETISSLFKKKVILKNDFFIEEGMVSKYLAFITKGLFQYFYNKEGKEITTYISGENTFLASLGSFINQQPGKECVRAIADSEVWIIHYNDLQQLKKDSEPFKTFYIEVLEHLIVCMDDSKNKLITHTAEERYASLLKDEPGLLQQIPLQYLATILGVTPRHLSRIRNNIR